MGCGCAERRKMLTEAGRQAAQGQVRQAAQQVQRVAQSMAQDARRLANNAAQSQFARMTAAGRRR